MDEVQNQFKRSILYYPTMLIPSGQWLKMAVLYWDEVSSIVPRNYYGEWLVRKSRDLEYLLGEGEFYPFDPIDLRYHRNIVDDMADELKSTIDSDVFNSVIPAISDRVFDSKIHLDKISYGVLEYLIDKGLAKEKTPEGERIEQWAYFERATALLYMALLAKYLAISDIRNNVITTPGTDQPYYQKLSFAPSRPNNFEIGVETIINQWLPSPDPHTPIQDIVAFKRRRQDELLPLQSLLLDFEKQLTNATSIDEVKQIVYKFDLDKQKGLNDLNASLKDAKIETVWGSLNALIGVSSPPLIGFLTGKLAEIGHLTNPIAVGGIAFGVTAGIGIKAYLVARQSVVYAKLRNSTYSYLFHAQEELIIPG